MILSQEQIMKYARKYASVYISKYGENALISKQDAVSVAYIALANNNSYDASKSIQEQLSLIKSRVLYALMREYQQLNGKRRKDKIKFVSIEDNELELEQKHYNPVEHKELLIKAIQQVKNPRNALIVEKILKGETELNVANEFKLSPSRISQIISNFKKMIGAKNEK